MWLCSNKTFAKTGSEVDWPVGPSESTLNLVYEYWILSFGQKGVIGGFDFIF